jgi:hypothetical protein
MRSRRKYTDEFKREAVRFGDIARQLGSGRGDRPWHRPERHFELGQEDAPRAL